MFKKKKSIFSKIFINNILSAFIAVTVFTLIVFGMITAFISKDTENKLKGNAVAIEELIKHGNSSEYLHTVLRGFSISSNRDIIIIDNKCNILMHSVVTEPFDDSVTKVEEQFCRDVLSNRENIVKGNMGGMFKSNMFTLQIPVVDKFDDKNVLGAIMISMPYPETRQAEMLIIKIMLVSMLLVIGGVFIISYIVSKKLSFSIKQIGNSVNKFAKREFDERIDLSRGINNIEELRELANNFNNMADELERTEKIKDNFISDVSHELRTPMTTISGFVDGILDGAIPEEKQNDYLKIVKDEMARLTKLVNDFLDVTRMNNGSFQLKKKDFDITEMIRLSVISLDGRLEAKKINVELNFEYDSMYVNADYDSIKRVMTNLLDNAVKFTNEGGEIIINAEYKKQETIISVFNSGIGISNEDKPYIFKRFYKADKSRSTNKDGTGIGLFLVKDILMRHGKDIRLESEEGKFAKFIFSLDTAKNVK